mgnify:CR=1 FL=1
MDELTIPLAKQVGRVPSMIIPLGPSEEIRFRSLMERLVTIDLHQHPMVCPENMDHFIEYLRLFSNELKKSMGWLNNMDQMKLKEWSKIEYSYIKVK